MRGRDWSQVGREEAECERAQRSYPEMWQHAVEDDFTVLSQQHGQCSLPPKVGCRRSGCLGECRLSTEADGRLLLVPRKLLIVTALSVLYFTALKFSNLSCILEVGYGITWWLRLGLESDIVGIKSYLNLLYDLGLGVWLPSSLISSRPKWKDISDNNNNFYYCISSSSSRILKLALLFCSQNKYSQECKAHT